MLNTCIIQGRLVRDPQFTATASGLSVVNFSMACEEDFAKDGKRETTYIDFVAFRKTAEFICKHFFKGDMALVKGRLNIRSYTDKEGIKRKASGIIVDSINFCGSKRDRQDVPEAPGNAYTGFVPNSLPQGEFIDIGDDEPIPF